MNFELSTDSLSRGMLARSSLLSPHEKVPSIKDIRSDIQKLSRLLKNRLKAAQKFHKALVALSRLSSPRDGTTNSAELNDAHLQEFSNALQQCLEKSGVDNIAHAFHLRSLATGRLISSEMFDILEDACRRSESCLRTSTHAMSRALMQRLFNYLQTHRHDPDNCLVGQRASNTAQEVAISVATFDALARIREAEQQLAVNELQRSLFTWPTLTQDQICARALALAAAARDAWQTGALVMVPDGSTQQLCFARFSGRRVGDQLGVFLTPSEEKDELFNSAHVFPVLPSLLRQLSSKATTLVSDPFTRFQEKEIIAAERRIQRFLQLYGFDWNLCESLSAVHEAIALMKKSSSSPTRSSSHIDSGDIWVQTDDNGDRLLSVGDSYGVIHNLDILMADNNTGPKLESVVDYVRMAALTAARRFIATIRERFDPSMSPGHSHPSLSSHPDTLMRHTPSPYARRSSLCSVQSVDSIDMQSALHETESYKPFGPTFMSSIGKLELHCETISNFVYEKFEKNRQEHQEALVLINNRCKRMKSGRDKEDLNVWWSSAAKKMTLAFLESHGVDLDALEDDFMLSPPKDMHAVRRNYRLLRRALDADNDPLRTRQLLDAVRAKIYPRIDAFVDDALASVALTLRVPRSIFVRERHKPEALLEILRRKLNKDAPTEVSLRRGSLVPSLGSANERRGSANSSAHDSPRRVAAHNARRRSSMLGDHVAGGDMLLNGRRRMSATDVEERRALAGRRKSMGTLSSSLRRTDHHNTRQSSRFSESRSYMSGTSHTTSDESKDAEFSSAHDSPARSFSTPAAVTGTTPPPRRDSHTVRVPPSVLRQSDADWNQRVHRSVSSRSGGGRDELSSTSSSTTSSTFGSGTDGGVIDHASPVHASPRIVSCSSTTSSTHCTTSNDSSSDDDDDDDDNEKNSESKKEEVMVDASSSATISNASATTFLLPAHARRSTSDRQRSAARTSPAPRRHSSEDKATPKLHDETTSTESTTPMTTPPSSNKAKPQSPTRVKHRHRVGNTKTTLQASSSASTVTHRRHHAASTALLLSNSNVSAKSRKRRVRRRSGDSLPTTNQSVLRKGSRDDSDLLFTSLSTRRRLALMTHDVDPDDDDSSLSSAAARSSASASSLHDSGSLSPRILATAQYRRRSRDMSASSRWGVKPASLPNEIEMTLRGALTDTSQLSGTSTAAAVAAAAAAVDEAVQHKPRHNSDEFQPSPKFQLMAGLRRRSESYDESHIDTDEAPEWCHELLADVGYLLEMRQLEAAGVSDRLGVVPVSGIVIGRITRYFREHQNALELYDDGHASISTDDDVLPHGSVALDIADKHADDVPHSPRRSLLRGLSNKDNPDKRKKVPLGRYVLASLSLFGLRSSRHKVDDVTPRTLTQELSPRHPDHSPHDARRLSPGDATQLSPPDTVEADTTTFGMRSAIVNFDEDSGEHAENEALSRRNDARRLLNSATHVSMVGASDEEAEDDDDDDGASTARSKRRTTSHRRTKDKHSVASVLSASAARRRTSPDALFGLAAVPSSPMRHRSLSNAREDDEDTSVKRSPVSARRHRRVPSVDDGTTGSGSVPKLADEVDAAVDDVASKKKRKPLRRRSRHRDGSFDHTAAEDVSLKNGAVDMSRASSDTNNRRRRVGHSLSSTADISPVDATPDVDTPSPPVSPTRNTRRRRQPHASKRSYKAHASNSLRRHSGDMSAIRISSDGLSYEVSTSSSSSHGVHTPPRIQRRRSSVELHPNSYSISPPHVHGSMTERLSDHRHQLHSSPRRSTLRHSHERDKVKGAKKKK